MAKVLLINPVVREDDDPRHVPYGLALLASLIEADGHQYQVFDANAWRVPDETLEQIIAADAWDVIAIGGISTTYGYVKKAVGYAKQHHPRALVVAGGGLVTAMPVDLLQLLPAVDVGVVGEALETFPELLRKVDRGESDWDRVSGVAYREASGEVRLTPSRETLKDLDSLPYPKWDAFPLDIYFKNSMMLVSEETMQNRRRIDINGSYGCPFICRFCFHLGLAGDMEQVESPRGRDTVFTHNRVNRLHSPRYIVEMVKYLRDRYQVDAVGFLDENLVAMDVAAGGQWLAEICRLWIEEGLQPQCVRDGVPHDPDTCSGVHWSGTSHAGLATPELLRMMRNAGCSYLIYGLESFSDRIMRSLGKGATPKANERAVRITLEAGIRPIPNQIIGFPDEFFDSLRDDMHAWERMGIQVKPFFATPYPGSEWYYKYKDRILEQYDGDLDRFLSDLGDATRITAVISEHFNAVELLGLRELMVNRDFRRIDEYERLWRSRHGEPTFSDVRWAPAKKTHPMKTFASTPEGPQEVRRIATT